MNSESTINCIKQILVLISTYLFKTLARQFCINIKLVAAIHKDIGSVSIPITVFKIEPNSLEAEHHN